MARRQVFLVTLNDVGNREALRANTRCRRITLVEANTGGAWPTTDYEVSDVISGGQAERVLQGLSRLFLPSQRENGQMWDVNELFTYAATITGSVPFYQIEEW